MDSTRPYAGIAAHQPPTFASEPERYLVWHTDVPFRELLRWQLKWLGAALLMGVVLGLASLVFWLVILALGISAANLTP